MSVTIFWWILYPLLYLWRGSSLLLTIAETGLPIVVLSVAIPLWVVIDGVFEIVHLQRLKKKLKAGIPLDHNKRWKHSYRLYFGKRVIKLLIVLLWIMLFLQLWSDSIMDANKQEPSDYEGNLPFATMADFAEGTYKETWNDIRFDYVMEWSNSILTSGIKWSEHATVRRFDDSVLQGGLHITYYNARNEWLAKALAAEYQRLDRVRAGKDYAILDCTDFGLDSVVAYTNELHFPCVILQQGNIVIRAYFYQTGPDEQIPIEEWAGILADSIR